MKRVLLALAGTAAGLVGVLGYRTPPLHQAAAAPVTAPVTGSPTPGTTSPVRTLTGAAVDTRWGPVQVAVTLSGDRITAVQVLESPHGNRRDEEIGAVALPQLQAETLQAQSADIDAVSGATYTSTGYLSSLQSALDQK